MSKNQSNTGNFIKSKEIEGTVEVNEPIPQEWVCVTNCYCSDNGDPIRAKLWKSGEICWQVKKPSKHFTTREDYNKGGDGRAKYFQLYTQFGGIMIDQLRSMPADVLKIVVDQQKRDYMRKQAQSS